MFLKSKGNYAPRSGELQVSTGVDHYDVDNHPVYAFVYEDLYTVEYGPNPDPAFPSTTYGFWFGNAAGQSDSHGLFDGCANSNIGYIVTNGEDGHLCGGETGVRAVFDAPV